MGDAMLLTLGALPHPCRGGVVPPSHLPTEPPVHLCPSCHLYLLWPNGPLFRTVASRMPIESVTAINPYFATNCLSSYSHPYNPNPPFLLFFIGLFPLTNYRLHTHGTIAPGCSSCHVDHPIMIKKNDTGLINLGGSSGAAFPGRAGLAHVGPEIARPAFSPCQRYRDFSPKLAVNQNPNQTRCRAFE